MRYFRGGIGGQIIRSDIAIPNLIEVTNPIYLIVLEETSNPHYTQILKQAYDGSYYLIITHVTIPIVMKFSKSMIEIETIIDDLYDYHSLTYQQYTSIQDIMDNYT